MEPGGAAEKWRNHGHGRYFPGNLYTVCDRPSSGPSFDCRHWIDGNCLSPKGKISGTCGSESGDLRVLTVFHDSAGHISRSRRHSGRGICSGWMDARKEEVSEEERPREEEARGENEETEMEETTEAERNLEEHISLQETVLPRQLLFLGTNENDVTVSGEIRLSSTMKQVKCCRWGTCISITAPWRKDLRWSLLPRDRNGQNVPYDHYEINLQVEERSEVPGYEYLGDQLVITANVGVNGNTW